MFSKIPLAWLQLSRVRSRLLVAIAGIAFADILMFMQLGFQNALYDSSVRLHTNLSGDIFLVSPQSTALIAMKSFPQRRLYQSLAFEGIDSGSSLYVDFGLWKNPKTKKTRGILVIGFNPKNSLIALPEVQQNLDKIQISDVVLLDQASKEQFGTKDIVADFNQGKTVETEVASRRIKVQGLFSLGASFGADGNIITSDLNFLRLFPRRDKGLIDVGVLKVKPGTKIDQLVLKMRQTLPEDVKVMSHKEFIAFEKNYWETGTAIGFIFTLSTAMGFIVGTVIVYQILYTDVADHLPEYATLKAMGYTTTYLLGVVFQEALILAILGFFPGLVCSVGLYNLTRNATSLPMLMTFDRATLVLILTILMCFISGAIAVRKLQAADPADIF